MFEEEGGNRREEIFGDITRLIGLAPRTPQSTHGRNQEIVCFAEAGRHLDRMMLR